MSNIIVLPNDSGIRPAGDKDKCFYCNQEIGANHKDSCVMLERKIKVRFSFDIETLVPHFWGKEIIESHYNESSWCADNAVDIIVNKQKKLEKENKCMCCNFKAEVLEIPEMEPIRG